MKRLYALTKKLLKMVAIGFGILVVLFIALCFMVGSDNSTSKVETESVIETAEPKTTVEETTVEEEYYYDETDEDGFYSGLNHDNVYFLREDEVEYMPQDLEFTITDNKIKYGDIWSVKYGEDFEIVSYDPNYVELKYLQDDTYNIRKFYFGPVKNPDSEYWIIETDPDITFLRSNEYESGGINYYYDQTMLNHYIETDDGSTVRETCTVYRCITDSYTAVEYDYTPLQVTGSGKPAFNLYK